MVRASAEHFLRPQSCSGSPCRDLRRCRPQTSTFTETSSARQRMRLCGSHFHVSSCLITLGRMRLATCIADPHNVVRRSIYLQVYLLGKHIGKTADEIERVIARPTYFNPYEAVGYGIIDRVRRHLLMRQCFRTQARGWRCHVRSSRDVI